MLYEKITKQELKAMENEYGFTPNYSYDIKQSFYYQNLSIIN